MPKKNGFFYFMLEYKNRHEAAGYAVSKLDQITPLAGKIWEKMDAKQREPYIQKAKSAQNEGGLGKLNSLGMAISEVDKKLRSKEDHTQMIKRLVAERVANADSGKELDTEVMYIISMAYFGQTIKGTYIPAEVGVVKYSLKCGVMDRMHLYINPGEIPLGAALSTQKHTAETHNLPLPPNAWGSTDMNEVAVKLISFLAADDEIPPLFTDETTLPITESMLQELLSGRIEGKTLYVCPLSELFFCLKQATERHVMETPTFPSARMAQHILMMDCYGFTVGISCDYHDAERNPINCALSQATRWAYTISKHCCLHMGIECVQGKHIPCDRSADDDGVKPATSGSYMLSKLKRLDDSHAGARSASQNPIANSSNSKRTLSGSMDKPTSTPHIPYVDINLNTYQFPEPDQSQDDAFPSLLQSMEPTLMGRGHSQHRGRNVSRGGRGARGRAFNLQQRGN